jgi:hypothetical protein
MRRITVLFQRGNPFDKPDVFLIWYIAQEWQKMGFEVEFINGIPSKDHKIDILLPHIDLTRVPASYLRFMERHELVLNRRVADNSKRSHSRQLVLKGSDYEGPVIVKTDANYGGLPEYNNKSRSAKLLDKFDSLLRPSRIKQIKAGQYPVYDHISQVPPDVWKNHKLIVEKYIPERDGEFYCIRVCHFFGDVMLNNKLFARTKVIKGRDAVRVEPVEIPEALLLMRKQLGFDYGKFDYVMHNGEFHLLDANKTPGTVKNAELNARIAKKLSLGINGIIEGAAK